MVHSVKVALGWFDKATDVEVKEEHAASFRNDNHVNWKLEVFLDSAKRQDYGRGETNWDQKRQEYLFASVDSRILAGHAYENHECV